MVFVKIVLFALWAAYAWYLGQLPATRLDAFGRFMAGSFYAAAPALYAVPLLEALRRDHPAWRDLALLNILLGWTGVGWIAALVWACHAPLPRPRGSVPARGGLRAPSLAHDRLGRQAGFDPLAGATIVQPLSAADELRKFADLKEDGILTDEEFDALKRRLLDS